MGKKENYSAEVAVLAFQKGPRPLQATVVTDGARHKSFTLAGAKNHKTLTAAIAYLESRGYSIVTDKWT